MSIFNLLETRKLLLILNCYKLLKVNKVFFYKQAINLFYIMYLSHVLTHFHLNKYFSSKLTAPPQDLAPIGKIMPKGLFEVFALSFVIYTKLLISLDTTFKNEYS